jgi:hypothetical protein
MIFAVTICCTAKEKPDYKNYTFLLNFIGKFRRQYSSLAKLLLPLAGAFLNGRTLVFYWSIAPVNFALREPPFLIS